MNNGGPFWRTILAHQQAQFYEALARALRHAEEFACPR